MNEDESDSDDDDDEEDEEEEKEVHVDESSFKERIVNFASELAFLADYKVIDIMINMINNGKFESNEVVLNDAIARFIKKIDETLRADWLFF